MILLGIVCTAAALFPLYLKYRVVLTGERCKGKITGIAEQRGGYAVGAAVKKHAYLVKIRGKQYYTAHGCLFVSLGRKKVGKEIWVFKNEKYGGAAVKKHAYLVKIRGKQYYTAHGCLFVSLGRKKVGKEIWVFKNEKYGREVFACRDFRIEALSVLFLLAAVLFFLTEVLK